MQPMRYHNNLPYQLQGPTTADDLREKMQAFSVLFGEHELQVRGEWVIEGEPPIDEICILPDAWLVVTSFSETHLVVCNPSLPAARSFSVSLDGAIEYRIQPDF